MRVFQTSVVVLLAALASTTAHAEATPCANQARLDGIAAVLERRPDDAALYYWQAATLAECGRKDDALAALAKVRELGAGYLPVANMGFRPIWEDPGFRKAYADLEAALPKVGKPKVALRFTGSALIPEGIAYDAKRDAVFLGSIAQKQILIHEDGKQRVFADAEDGLDAVLGLAWDAELERLYAVSTSALVDGAKPHNALFVFDRDGERVRRLDAAEARQLNDVAFAPDGTVYVTDSAAGGVWSAKPDDAMLTPFVPLGSLAAANGIAYDAAHAQLYVAHGTGIVRVPIADPASLARMTGAGKASIAALDGLYLHDDRLIGIHNATNPGSVIAISLDDAHTAFTKVDTLLSHHHDVLDEPTTAAIAGNELLVIANSHVASYGRDGRIADGAETRDPVIVSVPLARE